MKYLLLLLIFILPPALNAEDNYKCLDKSIDEMIASFALLKSCGIMDAKANSRCEIKPKDEIQTCGMNVIKNGIGCDHIQDLLKEDIKHKEKMKRLLFKAAEKGKWNEIYQALPIFTQGEELESELQVNASNVDQVCTKLSTRTKNALNDFGNSSIDQGEITQIYRDHKNNYKALCKKFALVCAKGLENKRKEASAVSKTKEQIKKCELGIDPQKNCPNPDTMPNSAPTPITISAPGHVEFDKTVPKVNIK